MAHEKYTRTAPAAHMGGGEFEPVSMSDAALKNWDKEAFRLEAKALARAAEHQSLH